MRIRSVCSLALAVGALALAAPNDSISAESTHTVYVAYLKPMNTNVTKTRTQGKARFTIDGDKLMIRIDVRGLPPSMEHWQHFHGFKDGLAASCATIADDANHDGIIDLIETEKTSGVTMVPFTADPANMDVAHGIYPKADANGDYHYQETVSLKALETAFSAEFPGQKLDLDKRVVYIHGVPAASKLPSTVASLGTVPAYVTLPISCGRIERVSARAGK